MVLIAEIGDERWRTMYDEKTHYACIVFYCHLWETNIQIYRYFNICTSFYKYIQKIQINTNSGEENTFLWGQNILLVYMLYSCYPPHQHNLSLLLTSNRSSFCYVTMLRIFLLCKYATHFCCAYMLCMFRIYITCLYHSCCAMRIFSPLTFSLSLTLLCLNKHSWTNFCYHCCCY